MAWLRRSLEIALGLGVVFALAGTGCGAGGDSLGITPGGAQDMRFARMIIEDGGIPTVGQFSAEGLFSEHDFLLPDQDSCDATMCPRASVATITPVDETGEQVLMHLGFASNIEDFQRRDLNVAVAVDTSGSMRDGKLDAVKAALHTMVDQLDDADRMALISFSGSARRRAWSTLMDSGGRAKLHRRIDRLSEGGGTDIEAGLEKAYKEVHRHDDGHGGREDRVMLFTDAQPNIGATATSEFMQIVGGEADEGVGISVFGVGIDLGFDLAREISELRGGNSFYLSDLDAIEAVFDEDFDYIVSPMAYDVDFRIEPRGGMSFERAIGAPDADASPDVHFSIATAFASSRGGAMGVLLHGTPAEGSAVADLSLTYETRDGDLVKESFTARWEGGKLPLGQIVAADHPGVLQLAVLYDEFLALSAGASYCEDALTLQQARRRVDKAAKRLQHAADDYNQPPLAEEAELMRKLSENLGAGGQCGGYYYGW
jgi:Ca-activated chloride channel family protein